MAVDGVSSSACLPHEHLVPLLQTTSAGGGTAIIVIDEPRRHTKTRASRSTIMVRSTAAIIIRGEEE